MLTEPGLVTAIDLGTTKVCTIVGHKTGTRGFGVLAHSTVPCKGLRKGNVADIAATEKAVRESIREVERATGQPIDAVFVGVTGAHVGFENRRDRLNLVGDHGVITADHLHRNPESSSPRVKEPGRKIIHAIRTSYTLDGEEGIRHPMGMHSRDVEADTHLVTGGTSFIDRLVRAVENTGVKINSLVLEPFASGLAVMTPEEKERGAVLVDIGGGTTDVVVFERGSIRYTGVIPVGGYQFTNDISLTFNTPYEAAEATKLKYASTELFGPGADEEVSLPVIGQDSTLRVKRMDICQLTRERAQELCRLVQLKLEDAQLGDQSNLRMVLTGGASNLPGLLELMQRSFTVQVRHGVPGARGTIPIELKDPAYATSIGILLWAVTEYVPATRDADSHDNKAIEVGPKGFLSGIWRRFSKLTRLSPSSQQRRKGGTNGHE